jgi:hypothetical protein
VHTAVAPDFTAAVDALVVLPPPVPPSVFEVRKRQAVAWLAGLRAKASARVGRGT